MKHYYDLLHFWNKEKYHVLIIVQEKPDGPNQVAHQIFFMYIHVTIQTTSTKMF